MCTIVLHAPKAERVSIYHSLEDPVLDVAKLREKLLQEGLILPREADELEFVDPFSKVERVLDVIPKDVSQVYVKQEMKPVFVIA
jgi:hypothetical protein